MNKFRTYGLLALASLALIILINVNNSYNPPRGSEVDSDSHPTITKAWNDLSFIQWTISTTEGYTVKRTFPSLLANSELYDKNNNLVSYTKWTYLMSRDIMSHDGIHLYTISPSRTFSNLGKHIATGVVEVATSNWNVQPEFVAQEFNIYKQNGIELVKIGMIDYYQIGAKNQGFGLTLESSMQILDVNRQPIVSVGKRILDGPLTFHIEYHNLTSTELSDPRLVTQTIGQQSFSQFTRATKKVQKEEEKSKKSQSKKDSDAEIFFLLLDFVFSIIGCFPVDLVNAAYYSLYGFFFIFALFAAFYFDAHEVVHHKKF